mgnify:CR=1 FL=1|jgi:HEAT repeat protein
MIKAVMMRQKLIDYHVSRLHEKQVSVRLDAIRELVLLDAFEALDALEELFQQDENYEVRLAAQQAGRRLFREAAARSLEAH